MDRRPKLSAHFTRLWLASAVSNVGDGITLAAGPLLLASLTDDPVLIAGAVFAQQLPWLLFSLVSGAYADRLDRRRLIIGVNVARGLVLGTVAVAIAAGAIAIPVVYAAVFLLGTAETLADSASSALLTSVVPPEDLPRANARLSGTFIVANQFLGPPVGAYLFVVAAALPFGFDAATFVAAALLVATLPRRTGARAEAPGRTRLRTDIAEGLRWLWLHQTLRVLYVCLCLMNLTFVAAFATYVLYARERLGLGPLGFGVLISVSSVGGVLGSLVASRLEARFGMAALLRTGLVIETSTHLVLAVTRSPWVVGVTMTIFGVHAVVWGVVTMSLRQRVVPDHLLGRVTSVAFLLSNGGSLGGALVGGLVAGAYGLVAPFWLAFGAMVVLTATVWRRFAPVNVETASVAA